MPFDVRTDAATARGFYFRFILLPSGLPPRLRGVLGVSHPLDASFRNLPPGLVSCRCRPWAFRLRRLLPARSPADLSALGVLRVVVPLARHRLRGCQHRSGACRRFVGLALAALAPPLVVLPFEVFTFRSRSALPRRSSHGLLLGASNRSALRLHDPSASQRALQSFREPEGRLGSRLVSLRGVLADTGSHLAAGGPCLAPRGCVLASSDPSALRPRCPRRREIGRAHV